MRWVHRLALLCLLLSVAYSVNAQGIGSIGPSISAEFWLGLAFSVLFALIAGFTKGVERRVERNEKNIQALFNEDRQLQAQISMIRETLPERFHPRGEVVERFDKLDSAISALHRRMDFLAAGGPAKPPFPGT